MISTKNLSELPDRVRLKKICKAISVLDAILCQEWEFRYYSYNSAWDENEEFCEMRNGEGDQWLILFRVDGCVINGYAIESQEQNKEKLTDQLPEIFHEFIFGEPIKSIGTSFCIWTTELKNWQTGIVGDYDDHSETMLGILDGNPQSYLNWASEYFEESIKEGGIPLATICSIYEGNTLTRKDVLSIVDQIDDWDQLITDLKEIDYPYDFQ